MTRITNQPPRFLPHLPALSCALLIGLTLWGPFAQASGAHGAHGAPIGRPAPAAKATRTIELAMDDRMRFSLPEIRVQRGETVRFVLRNDGRLKHEMVLGTDKEIREHAQLMAKFPNMEHDDPNSASVAPGNQGELTWTFTRAGTFTYACLLPGHFEAGMHGRLVVR